MRLASFIAASFCLAAPATAQTLSAEIGAQGIAKVEARLAALPAPTPSDTFALGALHFLRGVEIALQERWTDGLSDPTGTLPFLRLPIPENANPVAFDPASVTRLFTDASVELEAAHATLTTLPDTADFGVEISLDDLWFDVNGSGTRDPGEGLAEILGTVALGGSDDSGTAPHRLPTVRFDVADAAWFAAYADLLAAICDLVRAYDPTEPLTRITTARGKMNALGPLIQDSFFGESGTDPRRFDEFDLLAVIDASLRQQPDRARMASAKAHLLAMVAENRSFWTRVAAETDDDHEWLPNDHQHSALGIEVPPDASATWRSVLDDIDDLLTGKKLIPFWRAGPPAGLNLSKFFDNPIPIDIVGWVEGWAALPYLEQGALVSTDAMDRLDSLTEGNAPLFALYFN